MSDESTKKEAQELVDRLPTTKVPDAEAVVKISYCPKLDVYHYRRADGAERFFTEEQLIIAIDTYLHVGDTKNADYMVQLTKFARIFPHSVFTVWPDGRYEIKKLTARKFDDEGVEVEPGPNPEAAPQHNQKP